MKKRSERQGIKGKIFPTECRVPERQGILKKKKKVFLTEQCKEIEEHNRKVNTRDFFKKIGDNKEIFHARMNMIKDSNGKDQIKKRWQEYTEEL